MHANNSSASANPLSSAKRKLLYGFVALALCLGIGCLSGCSGQDASQSASRDAGTFEVALTVVDTVNDKVVHNMVVQGLTEEDTVSDMLAKAGMTEVQTLEETTDNPTCYVLTNDSPYWMGLGYDPATNYFWTTMFEGSSDNWEDAMSYSTVKADGHYQYIYGSNYSFEYTEAIPDPLG